MTSNRETEDPWDWDVDRVVQELCTTNRSWQPQSLAMPSISDPKSLERILREQEVTGCVILEDIDMNVLKEDFGIKALGRRSFIMSAIAQLRKKSLKYNAQVSQRSSNIVGTDLSHSIQRVLNYLPWDSVTWPSAHSAESPQQTKHSTKCYGLSPNECVLASCPELTAGSKNNDITINCQADDCAEPIPTRRSLATDVQSLPPEIHGLKDNVPALETPESHLKTSNEIEMNNELSTSQKKRKRIVPELVSPYVRQEIHKDSSALNKQIKESEDTNKCFIGSSQDYSKLSIPHTGVQFFDSDGRKRIIPFLQANSNLDNFTSDSLQKSLINAVPIRDGVLEFCGADRSKNMKTRRKNAYMGRKKMPVDTIFYEETPVGCKLSCSYAETEFYVVSKQTNKGRRLFVHKALKFFLRAQRQYFYADGNHYYIVVPYSEKLVPKFQKQSFTLYRFDLDENVVAQREVDIKPFIKSIRSRNNEFQVNFGLFNQTPLDFVGSGGNWNYNLLEKYNNLEDDDKILPPYGESDEDNEYDEATWKEIEEEFGKRHRPRQRLKKPHISIDEVIQAIDNSVSEIVSTWKAKDVIKRKRKAYRIWTQSRRLKNKHEQITAAQIDLNHTQEYLTKMRNTILSDVWTSQAQVVRQVGSMKAALFDQEELKWRIFTLKQKRQPEKISPSLSMPRSKKLPDKVDDVDGEDICVSENESFDDYEDDMEDFIVEDDPLTVSEEDLQELNLADTESDYSSDNNFLSKPAPTLATKFQSDKYSQGSPHIISDHNPAIRNYLENKAMSQFKENCEPSHFLTSRQTKPPAVSREHSLRRSPNSFTGHYVDLTSNLYDDATLKKNSKNSFPENSPKALLIDMTLNSSDEDTPKDSQPVSSSMPQNVRARRSKQPSLSAPIPTRCSKRSLKSFEAVSPAPDELPPYDSPELISKYSYHVWRQLGDRNRLLIKFFYQWNSKLLFDTLQIFVTFSAEELWNELNKIIEALSTGLIGSIEERRSKGLIHIIYLFEMFIDCRYHSIRSHLNEKQLKKVQQAGPAHFHSFYQLCIRMTQYLNPHPQESEQAEIHSPTEDDNDETISSAEPSPRAKRKKILHENKEARDMREQNLRRLAQQDERRKKLYASLAKANDDEAIVRSQLIVNDAAAEGQKYIYINDHISKRIKRHQVEGVRFMWNQIVTVADEESMQGCLLAHTMGLGKTMQTITLLVAIAEATCSADPLVSSQIPDCLRESKTLILCPPSLVNNWMDELLVWVPNNLLGELRKVDSSIKYLQQRLQTINDWYDEGGILVIGYEMFRDLINYKNKSISEPENDQVSQWLLEGPNIIIADEAHRMKNTKAAITIAASKFRSKSRIALTGSPLANSVEEYHTMIEWVAPNYLGPIVEFRAKYVVPIQAGNYQNSTSFERRKSLKMLGVLSADLAPKVHRADMSVLKNDLPPKKEFVITVPLTDIQKEAYSIFVRSMMAGKNYATTKSGDVATTTVWHWLAVLSLLCNHPECFRRKLLKRKEEARNEAADTVHGTDNEEGVFDLNAPIWKVGVSQELVDAENKIFDSRTSLDSVQTSNKVLLLCQILDSCKAVGEKALVFSQSIPTLDFLEDTFKRQNRNYARLDGSTNISKRQGQTKDFNNGNTNVFLISTAAGGLGLNLQGANRVIIFDFKFNPIMEEQAIGRAYRIGQKKPTFVYRFIAGGTFEDSVHNKTVFKTQLASRVVDKKNPIAWANKKASEFLFEPKTVPEKDLSEFEGMDPSVLDPLLRIQKIKEQQGVPRTICSIVQTDTFAVDDNEKLTPDEEKEVQSELEKTRLFRANPQAALIQQINEQQQFRQQIYQLGTYPFNEMPPLNFHGEINLDTQRLVNKSITGPAALNPYQPSNCKEQINLVSPNERQLPIKTSMPYARMAVGRARSPVAGASTKVSNSEPINLQAVLAKKKSIEDSKSTPKVIEVIEVIEDEPTKKLKSPEIEIDIVGEALAERAQLKDLPEASPSEIQISEEPNPKQSKKISNDWDMTRRYRESRASHVPDYGPIAISSSAKTASEPGTSKNPFLQSTSRRQGIGIANQNQTQGGHERNHEKRIREENKTGEHNKGDKPVQTDENIRQNPVKASHNINVLKKVQIPSQGKINSLPPRPPTVSPRTPQYHRSFAAPNRRNAPPLLAPTGPREFLAPTGPRDFQTRSLGRWEGGRAESSSSYREQGYSPVERQFYQPPHN
ncbi:unnamed protein product [Blumeria hordei]|uniref:Uncharacterized protein n=1 Tax=Blumeria hordei TaxID=2867405 RepID=A0A383UM38_BLUHO|nr:unnamed protein product [Blumeria hordei]